jgi:hypothetical protein
LKNNSTIPGQFSNRDIQSANKLCVELDKVNYKRLEQQRWCTILYTWRIALRASSLFAHWAISAKNQLTAIVELRDWSLIFIVIYLVGTICYLLV